MCARQNAGDRTLTALLPAKSLCSGWEGPPKEPGTMRTMGGLESGTRAWAEVCALRGEGRGMEKEAWWAVGSGHVELQARTLSG